VSGADVVEAVDLSSLSNSIGDYGLAVSARPFRTNDEREAYCLRRYLLTLAHNNRLTFPLVVTKSETPDFVLTSETSCGLEVTEATSELDQREYTEAAKSGQTIWSQGEFGGTGYDGFKGNDHELFWLRYVSTAIEKKSLLQYSTAATDLLIYSNSTAGGHVADERAFELTGNAHVNCIIAPLGSLRRVSIIKSASLLVDIFGSERAMLRLKQ
jgi:hypothetical protein